MTDVGRKLQITSLADCGLFDHVLPGREAVPAFAEVQAGQVRRGSAAASPEVRRQRLHQHHRRPGTRQHHEVPGSVEQSTTQKYFKKIKAFFHEY
jgi:hypothetical protein